tara:strand:- start:156 stop:437 length:282 start_codon:yes stop_codon:yes gene_type:complete
MANKDKGSIQDTLSTAASKFSVSHNLYDILGQTLLDGVKSGRLNPKRAEDLLRNIGTANIGVDLGKGYGLDIGYNQYIGNRRQDLKLNISKKF